MPLFKITLAFAGGILASNLFNESLFNQKEFIIFLFFYFIFSVLILQKRVLLKGSYWVLIFFLGGLLHYHFTDLEYNYKHFSNQDSKIIGFRVDDINHTKTGLRLLSTVEYIGNHPDTLHKANGRLMVYIKGEIDDLSTGTLLFSRNTAFLEKKNTNPHVFDYKNYLNHRAIYHRMYLDSTDYILTRNSNYTMSQEAGKIREKCLSVFKGHLDKDNLAVAAAMILGERKLLDDELYDAFTDTGAVHVLAVSGLHVGIVSLIISFLFKFIYKNNRKAIYIKVALSILSVWAFALLTGMAAAVTRAGLMFTLLLLGQIFRRKTNSYNVLSCAALIMLAYDPHYLFQAGFQFSFLALTGILYFYKPISNFFVSNNKVINYLWGLIAVSISAQLLVSPLAIFYFHKLPNYFWLTGIIAVPGAFLILTTGLTLLALHFTLGATCVLTTMTGVILKYLIMGFNWCIFSIQQIPYCSADNLWLSKSSLILIYSALFLLALYIKFRKPKLLLMTLLLILAQSILHISENKIERRKELVIIYDSYKSSFIDIYKSGHSTSYSLEALDKTQSKYINGNNKLYHRIVADTILSAFNIDTSHNLMRIDNHLMLLYPSKSNLDYCISDSIDLAILSKNSYHDIEKLTERYPIKKVILDGTFKSEKYWLRKQLDQEGIPCHLTSLQGAFVYHLN